MTGYCRQRLAHYAENEGRNHPPSKDKDTMSTIKPSDLPIITAPSPRVTPRRRVTPQEGRGPLFNTAGLCGSALMGRDGFEKLLGNKRIYHGTSPEAAQNIRINGLHPQYGGTGAAAPVARFVKNSTGKCHVTTRPVIAKLFEKHQDPRSPVTLVGISEEALGEEITKSVFSRGGPGMIRMNVPYECFARMKADPDLDFAYTTDKPIEPVYIKDGSKNLAARIGKLCRLYPGYVFQFPARAARGGIQTVVALVLAKYFSTTLGERLQGR